MGNVMGGIGNGLLSILGLGSLVDPLGDAKAQLNNAINDMNSMTAVQTLAIAMQQVKIEQDLLNFMQTNNNLISETVQSLNNSINNDFDISKVVMGTLAIIVMIFLAFYIAEKKCC